MHKGHDDRAEHPPKEGTYVGVRFEGQNILWWSEIDILLFK